MDSICEQVHSLLYEECQKFRRMLPYKPGIAPMIKLKVQMTIQ